MRNTASARPVLAALVASLLTAAPALAQGSGFMAAGAGTGAGTPVAANSRHQSNLPPVRSFSAEVRNGILTVDGMVGKAQMNYTIRQGFMYFTVPGVGTAIVAQGHFLNSAPQKNAFHGNELTIDVNGHTVELTSDGPLLSAKNADAWVAVDPLYGADITFPQMGFGDTIQRPYVWPGSKTVQRDTTAFIQPPPLPASVRPKPEITSSYTVVVPPTATAQR